MNRTTNILKRLKSKRKSLFRKDTRTLEKDVPLGAEAQESLRNRFSLIKERLVNFVVVGKPTGFPVDLRVFDHGYSDS